MAEVHTPSEPAAEQAAPAEPVAEETKEETPAEAEKPAPEGKSGDDEGTDNEEEDE